MSPPPAQSLHAQEEHAKFNVEDLVPILQSLNNAELDTAISQLQRMLLKGMHKSSAPSVQVFRDVDQMKVICRVTDQVVTLPTGAMDVALHLQNCHVQFDDDKVPLETTKLTAEHCVFEYPHFKG